MSASPSMGRAISAGAIIGFLADVVAVVISLGAVIYLRLPSAIDSMQIKGNPRFVQGVAGMIWFGVIILIGGPIITGLHGVLAGMLHALTLRALGRRGRISGRLATGLGCAIGLLTAAAVVAMIESFSPMWGKEWIRSAWIHNRVACYDWESFGYALAVLGQVGMLVGSLAGWLIHRCLHPHKCIAEYRRQDQFSAQPTPTFPSADRTIAHASLPQPRFPSLGSPCPL